MNAHDPNQQPGALTDAVKQYLIPYVRAWGNGTDVGDGFDQCINAEEASDFLARGIAALIVESRVRAFLERVNEPTA